MYFIDQIIGKVYGEKLIACFKASSQKFNSITNQNFYSINLSKGTLTKRVPYPTRDKIDPKATIVYTIAMSIYDKATILGIKEVLRDIFIRNSRFKEEDFNLTISK